MNKLKPSALHRELYDRFGNKKVIQSVIAQGGEGQICAVAHGDNLILCKLFLNEDSRREDKLKWMFKQKELIGNDQFAWPVCPLFDENQKLVAYAMAPRQGESIHNYYLSNGVNNLSRLDLCACLISFVEGLMFLHEKTIMVGDINDSNFLFDMNNNTCRFMDCDSFQINDGKQQFLCNVGRPEFTAPELLDKNFNHCERVIEHEVFSAGVLIFKSLMLGQHPYMYLGGSSPIVNLRKGFFPYSRGDKIPPGPWAGLWEQLPEALRICFISLFHHGWMNAKARPSLDDLHLALTDYAKGLKLFKYSRKII